MNVFGRLTRYFGKSRSVRAGQPVIEPAKRLYVIGDIHGRADLLERLLGSIIEDTQKDPPSAEGAEIVFLGDYIDRGDHSAGVIEMLMRFHSEPQIATHFLKGNHEAMMLHFIADPEEGASWLRHGGLSTLLSYGVRGMSETSDAANCIRAARELREALGHQLEFLRNDLKLLYRSGNVICVHAGFDVGVPADTQREHVLLWGHENFLTEGGPSNQLIVHGHTITSEPDFGKNRLGIDTGAYYSGRLTAVRIDPNGLRFIMT